MREKQTELTSHLSLSAAADIAPDCQQAVGPFESQPRRRPSSNLDSLLADEKEEKKT